MARQSIRARFEYDLLDRSGYLLGSLEGVKADSGSITRSASASVKASATLSLVDSGQVSSWLDVRIRPRAIVNDDEWSLGVYLPDVPERAYSDRSREMEVSLLDKTTILDGDSFGRTYGVQSGANLLNAVKQVIESTGEPPIGVDSGTDTLRTSLEWEPADSKLQVVNDLLDAGNYFSLYTSGNGRFRADPYVRPADRPVAAEFIDGESADLVSAYLPEFSRVHDIGHIPNRVRCVSQADGEEEALVAEAVNDNPDDPFSFTRRGFWITAVETDVATSGQATLQAYAERRLIELSSPQETVVIQHPPNRVTINDAVMFSSRLHEIDGLWTVQRQEWTLSYDGMVSSTLRRVIDL